ncbi:MAG: OmpA family protein [Xanthomarina sp.]
MLQAHTINKFKIIVLSIGILCSVNLFAQSEKASGESTIVMTKSELNSFLGTIADARRAQLKERENRRLKEDLAELRLKYQERPRRQMGSNEYISNEQILTELRYLNQRIDNLSSNNRNLPSQNRDNSTIIMPSNAAPNPVYPSASGNTSTIIPSNDRKIKELQAQLDSLKRIEAGKGKSFVDSLDVMKGRLTDVRRQMDSLESKMMAKDKLPKKEESTEDKSYFKQQVYFANNSVTLNSEYYAYIQDLTQILIKYPEAKLMLEGWASTKGKADYNKQLSMRRAEAVEKAFTNNRIDASRIITSFKGEDLTSSEQHARRVDMSIIVK